MNVLLAPTLKKKALQTYNFQRIFKGSFGSVSHTTTTKIEATRNKIPLKGLGTGLVNPSVHSDPNISKVTYPLLLYFSTSLLLCFSFFSNFRRKVLKEIGHGLGFYLVTPLVIAYSGRERIASCNHIRKDLLLVRRKRQPLIRNADI